MDTTVQEVSAVLNQLGSDWQAFRQKNEEEVKRLSKQVVELQLARNRENLFAGFTRAQGTTAPTQWIEAKSGKVIPALRHEHSLAATEPNSGARADVGRFLRGIALGGSNKDIDQLDSERKALGIVGDPGGGYTVSGTLANRWIDLMRAEMVLSRAGATTIPMDSAQLQLARVVTDPTVSWHGENAAISDGDPTFGAITLTAKTCVSLVKLSLELSQDSANIEAILQSTLVNAMAGAIDSAGLVGVTTDAAAAPGGVFNLSGRSKATSIGAPTSWDFLVDGMATLMESNVPMDQIGAFIAHPRVFKKMRKLKTGITSDLTSLVPPPEIAALPKLWTTAAPFTSGTTCSGIIAKWDDLLFGVRKDIQVRVLTEQFMGSNLQIAVLAYARVDFQAMRHASFYTAEGITI